MTCQHLGVHVSQVSIRKRRFSVLSVDLDRCVMDYMYMHGSGLAYSRLFKTKFTFVNIACACVSKSSRRDERERERMMVKSSWCNYKFQFSIVESRGEISTLAQAVIEHAK